MPKHLILGFDYTISIANGGNLHPPTLSPNLKDLISFLFMLNLSGDTHKRGLGTPFVLWGIGTQLFTIPLIVYKVLILCVVSKTLSVYDISASAPKPCTNRSLASPHTLLFVQ